MAKSDGDLRFGKIDLSPVNVDKLIDKFASIEDELQRIMDECNKLSDDDAYEMAKYLETMITTGMEPGMIVELLRTRLEAYQENG